MRSVVRSRKRPSRVCAGEIAQTYQRGEVNYSREFYFRVIQLKTAELV